jgi:hypothetical protein
VPVLSASAEVVSENGNVIKIIPLSADNVTGLYHFNNDFTGVAEGEYKILLKMDALSFEGITAKVTAYPSALGLIYVDGDFSMARAIGLGIFASFVFFLFILFVGSMVKK